jgi:hypothetical protein
VLVQNRKNPKIYNRSIECVLIGYSENSKAYRCYHRSTRKVLTSFNVVFIESKDEIPRPLHPGLILDGEESESQTPTKTPLIPPDYNDTFLPIPANAPIAPAPPQAADVAPGAEAEFPADESESEEEQEEPTPCRSGRERRAPGAEPTRTDDAVADAKASGARMKDAWKARREARVAARKEDGEDEDAPIMDDAPMPEEAIATIAAALENGSPGLDMTCPDDMPTLRAALKSDEAPKWQEALESEFNSLKNLDVYDLVPRTSVPAGRKLMHGKGVCKRKRPSRTFTFEDAFLEASISRAIDLVTLSLARAAASPPAKTGIEMALNSSTSMSITSWYVYSERARTVPGASLEYILERASARTFSVPGTYSISKSKLEIFSIQRACLPDRFFWFTR